MPTVQPPSGDSRSEPSPERHKIVLDERFYAALEPAIVDSPPPRRAIVARCGGASAWRFLDRTVESWARLWRVVLLGLTAVAAVAMVAFALVKAVEPAVLCMLVLVVVKAADEWNSRRLTRA